MQKKEKIDIALDYAKTLLQPLGLEDWFIGINKSYSVAAITNHTDKKIEYSDRYIALATKDDFRKATIHEATHALLGYGKGHGEEFVSLYSSLQPGDPFNGRCVTFPIHKYALSCNNCGKMSTSNSNKDSWCVGCATSGVGLYKLDVSVNKLVLKEWASTP